MGSSCRPRSKAEPPRALPVSFPTPQSMQEEEREISIPTETQGMGRGGNPASLLLSPLSRPTPALLCPLPLPACKAGTSLRGEGAHLERHRDLSSFTGFGRESGRVSSS